MSVQPAPTNTGTPVYNPINYINPTSTNGVTPEYLQQNYLQFPTAQGTEEFPNGLFSVGAIDFNSSNGNDRLITGLSKSSFTDILGNNAYTSYIEENSTAIGSYNGGLIIHSSNTIDLQGGNVLVNGTPITTGSAGNVNNNQNNTFQNGFTQTFDGAISIDNLQSNIGQLTTSTYNTAIGDNALISLTTGNSNTAFGFYSLPSLTTGNENTGLGWYSLGSMALGGSNTAVGYASLSLSTADNSNTAVGFWSGKNLNGGSNNTFIGYDAGINQLTGNNNLAIGYESGLDLSQQNLSNTIAIGSQATAVATGDMILGFGGNYNSTGFPYYAKITPNTTDQGVQIQGSYNNSGNFTINAVGQSAIIKGTFIDLTATSAVNVSNLVSTPNNPVINTTNLASSNGTFYVSSQLPYFAYNNAGTITSQQLATATSPTTFSYTSGLGGTVNIPPIGTLWTFNIPTQPATSTATNPPWGKTFRWSAYTNINSPNYNVNNNQVAIQGGFQLLTGTGVYQPTFYINSGITYYTYSYVLSPSINSLSGSSGYSIVYFGNQTENGVNQIQFTSPSTSTYLTTISLNLVIETIQ